MRFTFFFFCFSQSSYKSSDDKGKGAARVSGSPRASVPFSATPVVEIAPQ